MSDWTATRRGTGEYDVTFPEGVTLAPVEDVVVFEKGMSITIVGDPHCPRGHVYVTSVDRALGTITFANPADKAALRSALLVKLPELDGKMSPLQVGIAASVAVAGLGWLIGRRNALADQQDSESWAKAVAGWFVTLIRGLLGLKEPKRG